MVEPSITRIQKEDLDLIGRLRTTLTPRIPTLLIPILLDIRA